MGLGWLSNRGLSFSSEGFGNCSVIASFLWITFKKVSSRHTWQSNMQVIWSFPWLLLHKETCWKDPSSAALPLAGRKCHEEGLPSYRPWWSQPGCLLHCYCSAVVPKLHVSAVTPRCCVCPKCKRKESTAQWVTSPFRNAEHIKHCMTENPSFLIVLNTTSLPAQIGLSESGSRWEVEIWRTIILWAENYKPLLPSA